MRVLEPAFWVAAADRAIKTGAQFVLAVLGVGIASGVVDTDAAHVVNALALDYVTLGGAFLGGALVSVLTSLAFTPPEAASSAPRHRAS